MLQDFHYEGIAVLARAAGFTEWDARVMAYASQYTDDAAESEPIAVGELIFDPVRTAHVGLQAFEWATQKKVFIPFHFLPPKPIREPTDTFVTAPGSPFALDLVERACAETQPLLKLCRIGVALHTLADTWAHQGFSGRTHDENDVEAIHLEVEGTMKHLGLQNVYLDWLPEIGHAEAGTHPDTPYLTWRHTKPHFDNRVVDRNNTQDFLEAAKTIYGILEGVPKSPGSPPVAWADIELDVTACLAFREEDVAKRCAKWRQTFRSLFVDGLPEYDDLEWRDHALQPSTRDQTDWNRMPPTEYRKLHFPMTVDFYDSAWVQFHRAALKQRHYVLENLL
jgi:hypothetical protein